MSEVYENECFSGDTCRHGPPDVIVYICEENPASAQEHAQASARYALTRAWKVTETIVEPDPTTPFVQREGWDKALAAIESGTAEVILTWHPAHVGAEDLTAFQLMQTDFRNRHAVLAAVTGVPSPRRP